MLRCGKTNKTAKERPVSAAQEHSRKLQTAKINQQTAHLSRTKRSDKSVAQANSIH